MFLSGTDIYVAGLSCQTMDPRCSQPTYWKNGTPIVLTNQGNTLASSIFVSGAHVYVAGNFFPSFNTAVGQFWQDGVPIPLANSVGANQVFVFGSDVYVAGAGFDSNGNAVAGYWKNGTFVPLTDGTFFASGFAMTVVRP